MVPFSTTKQGTRMVLSLKWGSFSVVPKPNTSLPSVWLECWSQPEWVRPIFWLFGWRFGMGWVRPQENIPPLCGFGCSVEIWRTRSAQVEKFTCAAVTPNLIPSPPLHSTAPLDRRRPAPSPASPPGSRSAGLAQRRPGHRAGPA